MAANYRTTVLNTGSRALLQALGAGVKIPVGRFRTGTDFNFIPPKDSTEPHGTPVDIGYLDRIGLSFISSDELRVDLSFGEDVGDFLIGNVIIDLFVEETYVPFLMWVSDFQIPKFKFNAETGAIGNRYAFSFTEKIENIDDALDINVLPISYSSLPQYPNEDALPPAEAALFQNPVLHSFGTLYRPVIAGRRAVDNAYFGFPLLEPLSNPFFGEEDFGVNGFINAPFTGEYLWGGHLDTPDSKFSSEVISGGSLTDKDSVFGETISGPPLNYGASE